MTEPPGFRYDNASNETLAERALAGDGQAQYTLGFRLEQDLFRREDRSPYRLEYAQNFLILATKQGYWPGASLLAQIYAQQGRDVVEVAAWLLIYESMGAKAGGLEQRVEKLGLVLSEEQRLQSLRMANELMELYNFPAPPALPLVRAGTTGAVSGATDSYTSGASDSYIAVADCDSTTEDPFPAALAELEAYRAEIERNAESPGVVSAAELRRRFRAVQSQFVTSLRRGNKAALTMLVEIHRESSADEDAVAAAVWDELGRTRYAAGSGSKLSESSSSEVVDGVAVSTLADQYSIIFDLD